VKAPAKIGKYEVIDVIGRGGMGVVYKANDPQLDRLVAIKMMTVGYADDPDMLKRFYREARSTAGLQHANIVTVYDSGDQDGNPYLVMEFLEGESLDAKISSRQPLTVLEKIRFILETCRGLSYAHERGIVHRDIKPANIMVSKGGGVKLVDFGIAHIASNTMTRTGMFMGSVPYMSPEQLQQKKGETIDARTDIYSTGVVLFQLFTYALPFEGESTVATAMKIVHEPPPPLSKFLSNYPRELESIIFRALAKNRDDRYPSADDFALDLLQIHEQLKQDSILLYLHEAEALVGKGDLNRAKEQLQQLLKLDQKHTTGVRLLRQVQQRLEKEHGAEQVRQLRARAEESCAHGEFEAALLYLDQAVALDTTNAELPRLREQVKEAKLKAEELQQLLRRAASAHERGDLDAAKLAVDTALEINANDTQAKALYRIIQRDWVERSRQRQLEALLDSARVEITAHNLTNALNILKQAEGLDPKGLQVPALVDEVTAARERERRRRELEKIDHEVEEALNRDDYETASGLIERGLEQFPQDRSLLQFKALAARQRAAAERKVFVRQQIAAARQLLDSGQASAALELLQSATQKVPQEPQLETLLTMVQERVAREDQGRRREGLERLNREIEEALNREDFESASGRVEQGLKQFPQDAGLIQLKALVERQRAAAERTLSVRQQISATRRLLDAGQTREALTFLQSAIKKFPQEAQFETLLTMVKERVVRDDEEQAKTRAIQQARDALSRNAYREAVQILEAAQIRFLHSPEIDDLLKFAREQEVKESGRRAVEDAIRRAQQWIAGYQYERAIELLETTLRQVPDDQLRMILEETRRRYDDYQRDVQAAIVKARQFLGEDSPGKAVAFLQAQPASYRNSPPFAEVLKEATSLTKQQPLASDQKATVMMRAPAFEEPEISEADVALTQPPTSTVAGKIAPKLPNRTVALVAVAAAVALIAVVGVWKSLTGASPKGTLLVETNVAADVYVNGIRQGDTGGNKSLKIPLAPGHYDIRVQKEGYNAQPASQAVDIAKSKDARLSFELSVVPPPPPAAMGTLMVRTNVDGVNVFVDGTLQQNTGKDKKLKISIPAGNHAIRVEKEGYDSPSQQVEIAANKETNAPTFKLSQVAMGTLVVKTTVDAVDVFVDGARKGITRNRKLNLQLGEGKHEIRVEKQGYDVQPASKQVDITGQKAVPVEFALVERAAPPPSSIKPAAPNASFTASATTIQQGDSTTLKWDTQNATEVSIDNGIGRVASSGTQPVSPRESTTYTLTATGPGGTDTHQLAVSVSAPKAPVAMLSASSAAISQGQSTTLTWQTQNAITVTIDNGVGQVAANGSQSVSPSNSTTYTLTAKGPGGTQTVVTRVTVNLLPPPPTPGPASADSAAIKASLKKLEDAFGYMTVSEVEKVWPSLHDSQHAKQRKAWDSLFNNAKALHMHIDSDSCKETADSATATEVCDVTMDYTIERQRVSRTTKNTIALKKSGGTWVVDNFSGEGK
jgi:serine/threonine-protein kinase